MSLLPFAKPVSNGNTQSMPQAGGAGVHCVLAQEDDGAMYVKSLLRGGQLSRTVKPSDQLITVDGSSTDQKTLSEVRQLVSGIEGSQVSLGFARQVAGSREFDTFVTTVTRTTTELQDIQVAIFEDTLAMIADQGSPDGPGNIYDRTIQASWRAPNSVDGRLYVEMCQALRAGAKGSHGSVDNSQLARLQHEVRTAEEVANRLRNEMRAREAQEVCPVTLLLNHEQRMVTDAAARKRLQEETVQDVAHCLSVETTRLEVVGMHNAEDEHRGSGVYVDMHILADPRKGQSSGTARQLVAELVAQGEQPSSVMRGTATGMRLMSVKTREEVEFVRMLKRTVQLLQEDLDSLQAHDRRMTTERNDFSVELVAVQQNVTQLQSEMAYRDRTIEDLNGKVFALNQEAIAEREKALRLETDLMDERVRADRMQVELKEVGQRIASLLEDRRQLDAEVSRLRSLLDNSAARQQDLERELERLRALEQTIKTLQQRIADLDKQAAILTQDLQSARAEAASLLQERAVLTSERDKLRIDLEQTLRRFEPYEAEMRKLRDQLARLPLVEEENRKLARSLADVQQDNIRLRHDYERDTNQLRVEGDALKDTINALSVKNQRLEAELQSLRAQLASIVPEDPRLKEHLIRLQREKDELAAKIAGLEFQVRSESQQRLQAESMCQQLKEEMDLLAQKHRQAVTDFDRAQLVIQRLEEEKTQLEQLIVQLRTKSDALEQSLREQYAEHQGYKARTEGQIRQLQAEAHNLQLQKRTVEEQQEKAQAEASLLRLDAQRLRDLIKGMEDEKRRLLDELNIARDRIVKYSEIHNLDVRETSERDQVIKAQEAEIAKLRASFMQGRPEFAT